MPVPTTTQSVPRPVDIAPYYFMSYAHTPRIRGREGRDPNERIARFHKDLSGLLMELTTLPAGASPGFLDEEMDVGTRWTPELIHQLNHCRVFLPMLSPRYFTSDWTCKEWYLFSQRQVQAADGGETRNSGVLAITWAEFRRAQVPAEISGSQAFRPRVFGNYPELFRLLFVPRLEAEYQEAVYNIAKAIIDTAEEVTLSPSPITTRAQLDEAYENSDLYRALQGIRR